MRQVSLTALQAMMAQQTAEVFVPFLKIEHPSFANPIRLVYNTETIPRSDGDYLPYAFQIALPAQMDNSDAPPSVTLTVDNVDLEVNDAIRSITGVPKVTLDVALASTPNTPEAGPFVMNLTSATADANTIQGTLGFEADIFAQQVPGQNYLPTSSPGLFM